jgi:hypothetical protein
MNVSHAEEQLREYDVAKARMKTRALLEESTPVLDDLNVKLEQARKLLDRLQDAAEGLT